MAAGVVRCPACAAENQAGAGFCRGCGAALAGVGPTTPVIDDEPVDVPGGKISWGWVGLGVLMILALQLVIGLTVTPIILRKMVLDTRHPSVGGALGLILLCGAAVYFVCGLVIGRLSKGYTVKEPAIASLIAGAVNAVLSFSQGQVSGPGGLLLTFGILGGLGAAGGWVGEKLQARAEAGKRRL
jgi:hypothetical protein